ncbi:ROK family transcriptional regulator [Kitasatospora cineracea]|uniref:ROK family transcriptional regulator n=1 Tax=Kitasatospora cineracea TaxID=88074 RepID=UPI0033C68014
MGGPSRDMPHATSRAAVLDVIRAAGTISRVRLIEATGFTGATISTVVRRLIDDGLVTEVGRAESTGGKPRTLLALNESSRYAVGIHLDHSGITYVLTDLGGSVVARMSRAGVGTDDPPVVVARMADAVHKLIQGVGISPDLVLGLGLVAPGPLTPSSGMRLTPPTMRHWEEFPLDQALAQAVGLPVILENDATAAALGEHWSGVMRDAASFAALYVGTGIGSGLMIDGASFRGGSGNAGEIGHICLDANGPDCWCGARGCTEALAGPAAVVTQARADANIARAAGLTQGPGGQRPSVAADFDAVARAARLGDTGARDLLETSARWLALAARTLANIMDLEHLVLTGPSLAIAGSFYLPIVQEELDRAFFARAAHPVQVRLSASPATAPAIGAATMMLRAELVPLRQNGIPLPGAYGEAESTAPATTPARAGR